DCIRDFHVTGGQTCALPISLLAKHRGNRQVIMITDGEPTAHLEENGRASFAYPPTYKTIQQTLSEVKRCTRDRIVMNTFMLERRSEERRVGKEGRARRRTER